MLGKLDFAFDPGFVTEEFFPNKDVRQINCGSCFLWAYAAWKLFDGVELWSISSHAFVKYGDKFYDSEMPQGTKDWTKLRATNNGKGCAFSEALGPMFVGPARPQDENEFKKYWSVYNHPNWKLIDRKVEIILNNP